MIKQIISYRNKLEHFKLPLFFKKDIPKVFGRWHLEYCDDKLKSKVDWANTDHCGPCGVVEKEEKSRILWKQQTLRKD